MSKEGEIQYFKAKRHAQSIVDHRQIHWEEEVKRLEEFKDIPDDTLKEKLEVAKFIVKELDKVRSAIRNNLLYDTMDV